MVMIVTDTGYVFYSTSCTVNSMFIVTVSGFTAFSMTCILCNAVLFILAFSAKAHVALVL